MTNGDLAQIRTIAEEALDAQLDRRLDQKSAGVAVSAFRAQPSPPGGLAPVEGRLALQASAFVSGEIDDQSVRRMSKDLLKKQLLSIYGIGPATVQYALFEVFHKYDAFEHVTPWEQKIYSRHLT